MILANSVAKSTSFALIQFKTRAKGPGGGGGGGGGWVGGKGAGLCSQSPSEGTSQSESQTTGPRLVGGKIDICRYYVQVTKRCCITACPSRVCTGGGAVTLCSDCLQYSSNWKESRSLPCTNSDLSNLNKGLANITIYW